MSRPARAAIARAGAMISDLRLAHELRQAVRPEPPLPVCVYISEPQKGPSEAASRPGDARVAISGDLLEPSPKLSARLLSPGVSVRIRPAR